LDESLSAFPRYGFIPMGLQTVPGYSGRTSAREIPGKPAGSRENVSTIFEILDAWSR
jgi:hypothetical protein